MTSARSTAQAKPQEPPFPPSWVDQLLQWMSHLAAPGWLLLLALYAAIALLFHLLFWLDGLLPWGQLNAEIGFNAIWLPLALGTIAYLDQVAAQSWREFKPALRSEQAQELADFGYRLTTMPRWPAAAVMLLGPVIVFITSQTQAENYLLFNPAVNPASGTVLALVLSLSFAMLPLLAYHTVRQLQLVIKGYAKVERIDLYDVRPLFAFSGLSARTGIVLILIMNLSLVNTQIRSPGVGGLTETDALILGTEITLAVLAFLLPLWGIHRKLAAAKDQELSQVGGQLRRVHEEVNRRVQQGELDTEEALERTERLLTRQHNLLNSVSTWPWHPGTLRGFISAMVLPIVLWLVQQFLSRALLTP